MKKIFIKIFLLSGFSVLFCSTLYSAEDNNKSRLQSSQVAYEKSSQKSEQTPSRPILPPVVPILLPNVSPTPSPDITMPPITPNIMDVQRINQINVNNQFRNSQINAPALPDLPKLPVLPPSTTSVATSVPSTPVLSPDMQLIRNLLGTVIDVGLEKNEVAWLDVKDSSSGETVKVNVDPKKTRVIQKDAVFALKDIKTGDMVRVIFNQAGKEISVNVISIVSEEDLKTNAQPK